MIFRRAFLALLVLTISLAPLGMPLMASASVPPANHGAMASQGHCDPQSMPDAHHKAADNGCCAAMCIAVVVPVGAAEPALYQADRERPVSDHDRRGYLGEIATPPPKPA